MFTLVADESSQQLGIETNKLRFYDFESGLLRGSAVHNSTTRKISLLVEPNYDLMARIAEEREDLPLHLEFNKARTHSIGLSSRYASLSVADVAVQKLGHFYEEVLKKTGANRRFLVEEDDGQHLVEDSKASDIRYGEAILKACNMQAFAMLREGHQLDHRTIVGRIMPIFLQALGLKEYHVTHDLSQKGNDEVRFIFDKVAMFGFSKPQKEGDPAFLEKYSYSRGNYHLGFTGSVTGPVLKTKVLDYLVDLASDMKVLAYDEKELNAQIDEMAQDVRRSFIKKNNNSEWAAMPQEQASNVIRLGNFTPS